MIFENAILIAFTRKVPYLPVINIIHPLLFLCACKQSISCSSWVLTKIKSWMVYANFRLKKEHCVENIGTYSKSKGNLTCNLG